MGVHQYQSTELFVSQKELSNDSFPGKLNQHWVISLTGFCHQD